MPGASARAAVGAVTFLTRVPLGRAVAVDGEDVARGAVLFPVVGAVIGALAGGVAVLLHPHVPALVAAGIALAVAAAATGAMHVDALADSADGFGPHTREGALAAMRDSRLGTFGVTALVLDLLVKAAAVAGLLEAGGALRALVAAGALSRAASPPLARLLPYAGGGAGPGSVLSGRLGMPAAAIAAVLGVGIAAAVEGTTGLIMAGAVAATTFCLALVFRRRLGGVTGDSLGAVTELGETVALVVAVALT
jgi:cobalamin 5'-phosphate synthase/cobalamin synthase